MNHQSTNNHKLVWILVPIGIVVFLIFDFVIAYFLFGKQFLSPKQEVIFEPDYSRVSSVTQTDLEKTAAILSQRWQALGKGQFGDSFKVSNDNQIIGRLPKGVDETTISNLKKPGLVEFVDFGDTYFAPGTIVNTDYGGNFSQPTDSQTWHTIMTNSDLKTVNVVGDSGGFAISFELTENGTKIFSDFTRENIGKYLGIVVDKVVISCPNINGEILNGQGQISGSFTQEQVANLASLLGTPPLPIPLK